MTTVSSAVEPTVLKYFTDKGQSMRDGDDQAALPSDGEEELAPDPRERPIEPGRPDPENVVFVLLGAVLTFGVFLRGLGLV